MINELKKLIDSAPEILLTAHVSPDPDAVASVALLGKTLKYNYPEKTILPVLEEMPADLDFIDDYDAIEFKPVYEALCEKEPDLFILLDGNNWERCSRHKGGRNKTIPR